MSVHFGRPKQRVERLDVGQLYVDCRTGTQYEIVSFAKWAGESTDSECPQCELPLEQTVLEGHSLVIYADITGREFAMHECDFDAMFYDVARKDFRFIFERV